MSPVVLLLLAAVFAGLAFDAYQFRHSSRHRVCAATPPSRAIGVDPLSLPAQEAAQTNKYTAVGGIPGLHWVFVVLSVGCLVAAGWVWLFVRTDL
jgi:hypothetical protein